MAVMYRVFYATSDCWARRHCMHVSLELLDISRSSSAFVLDTSCGCACTPDCVLVARRTLQLRDACLRNYARTEQSGTPKFE